MNARARVVKLNDRGGKRKMGRQAYLEVALGAEGLAVGAPQGGEAGHDVGDVPVTRHEGGVLVWESVLLSHGKGGGVGVGVSSCHMGRKGEGEGCVVLVWESVQSCVVGK